MTGTPVAKPETTPVILFTVAIAGLLLLHIPPGVVFDKTVVDPTQVLADPEIAPGAASTVTCNVL